MKIYLLFATVIFAIGCKSKANDVVVIEPVNDTVAKIPDYPAPVDTIPEIKTTCDSLIILRKQNDSLKTALLVSQYKINRVKYYLAIVKRRPSQGKFLRGWIIRAVK